jgi:hypothetical protein
MKTSNTFFAIAILASVCLPLGAWGAEPFQAETTLQQVALFKNGLGFFISEAAIPEDAVSFYFTPDAAPSHGTFWVAHPQGVHIKSLIAKPTELEERVEVVSIPELLKANVGKRVKLSFRTPEESTVEGTILHFSEDRKMPKPQPYAPGMAGAVVENRGYYNRTNVVMIDTGQGQVGINPETISRVEFIDAVPARTFAQKNESMQLEIQLESPANGQTLQVSYLGKGVTWAPSYIVDISQEEHAQISAKAIVINEVCDMQDVTLQLVTGFPHLQFADIVSPLAMKENLAQFLESLDRGQSELGRSASVVSNVMRQSADWNMREDRSRIMPAYGAAQGGKVSEDLFFYPVKHVQLGKGQVGYFPLFTESVPYKHLYQWTIPDYVNEDDRYLLQGRDPQASEPQEEVWHSIRLENVTSVPWTTAPAQLLKDDLILGQDTLNYTPVQGKTTVPITRAASVKAEQVEYETGRQREAMQMYGYSFDLITVQGKLEVVNFLDKPITLEISKTLSGDVKSSDPEAAIKKLARGLRRVNATSELTWTLDLATQESKNIHGTKDANIRCAIFFRKGKDPAFSAFNLFKSHMYLHFLSLYTKTKQSVTFNTKGKGPTRFYELDPYNT